MKVLAINLRGCHLAYLGCYGNAWVSTPAIDRLATAGVVFDQHFADVPASAGARRAWRDGRHHIPIPGSLAAVSPFDLIASLRTAGVRTMLVADGRLPLPDAWLPGWDKVEVVRADESGGQLEQTLEVARAALEALAAEQNGLLWLDLATLLPPWIVPADFSDPYFDESPDEEEREVEEEEEEEFDEEDSEALEEEEDPLRPWPDPPVGPIHTEDDIDFCRLQSTCASAVSYLDAGLGVLLEELERLGLASECAVLLTGDHGQALGEHGFCGPFRPWLHDELVHIPLLLLIPSKTAPGTRVAGLTQSADLVPTLLELFGVAPPAELHGHSLLPLAREESGAKGREFVCFGLQIGEAIEWGLRTPTRCFLLPVQTAVGDPPRKPQLFVKPDDRWEVNDVIQHHLEEADTLEKRLREFVESSHSALPPRQSLPHNERFCDPAPNPGGDRR